MIALGHDCIGVCEWSTMTSKANARKRNVIASLSDGTVMHTMYRVTIKKVCGERLDLEPRGFF